MLHGNNIRENVDDEAAQSVMQNQLPEDLDVEKEVEHIRDLYYGTQECIDSFSQEEIDGITYFFDGNNQSNKNMNSATNKNCTITVLIENLSDLSLYI